MMDGREDDGQPQRFAPRGVGRKLGPYLGRHWRRLLLMAALLLGGVALQLLVPRLLRDFIDAASSAGAVETQRRIALLFLAVAVFNQLLAAAATYASADLGWRVTNRLRSDLARHVVGLDMAFHAGKTPGELIERIDGDVTALSDFFSRYAVRVFGGLLLLVGILGVLWFEHPWVGAGLTVFTLLELAVLTRNRRLGVPATTREREAAARLFGFIEERLAGLDDLRANGAGAHALARFNEAMRRFFFDGRRAWMMRSLAWLSGYGLFILGSAATLAAAIFLVQRGHATIGTGYMIFQYLLMLENQLDQITQHMQEVQKATAGLGRMQALFAEESALPPGGDLVLPAGPLAVEFDRVTFHYPAVAGAAARPTLDGVGFRLAPGAVLGLLGRTGSGKTTLTRLLFRLYDPTAGRVLLGGHDARALDPTSLRERVGLVTQDVQLFHASVRDNLTFFEGGVPDTRLTNLLGELGLGEWLDALPDGLDTVLAPGGGGLSAGEAQLLAFARVFLKDPGVVVLDEPSSRLDPETERRLGLAVDRLLEGRTAIIIAHRLETVARADEIMILGEGRVLEAGARERLAADPSSRYAAMLRAAGLAGPGAALPPAWGGGRARAEAGS